MIKTKERDYYEMLHSQDNLSVMYWNDNNGKTPYFYL